MSIKLPPLPRPSSYSAQDMRDYAMASVKAAVEERSAWKEAILEQLIVCSMDAPLKEPPESILRRVIDFHVMLDRDPVMQRARDPLSKAQVQDIIHARHFREGYVLHDSDMMCLRWYVMGLRDGEEAHGIKKTEHCHDWK